MLRSDDGGGVGRTILALAEGLGQRGHSVDVVSPRRRGVTIRSTAAAFESVFLAKRSRIRALANLGREIPNGWRLLLSPETASFPSLLEYLRARRPDAILTAGTYANVMTTIARSVAGLNTRIEASQHNHLSAASPRKAWKLRLVREFCLRADAVVAVSNGVALDVAMLAGIPRNRVECIYNPVVSPELHEMARSPVDHPWFQGDGPPIVLSAGMLKPRKDFAMLLRAFRQVRGVLDSRLVILGDGPMKSDLMGLARRLGLADSVAFLGFQANPYAFMARSTVFALSSRREGLANVVIEALACGATVVSTDCRSGPAEILASGQFGSLVPVGDADAMAMALIDRLEKPLPRRYVKSRGNFFTRDRAVDAYLRVLAP